MDAMFAGFHSVNLIWSQAAAIGEQRISTGAFQIKDASVDVGGTVTTKHEESDNNHEEERLKRRKRTD